MMETKKTTRGIRNNNPLNIKFAKANRWAGKVYDNKHDTTFEEFTNMFYGVRAAFLLLQKYITRGQNTIASIIATWCPPLYDGDTATAQYTAFVEKTVRQAYPQMNRYSVIACDDYPVIYQLMRAMCIMESNYTLPLDLYIKVCEDVTRHKW